MPTFRQVRFVKMDLLKWEPMVNIEALSDIISWLCYREGENWEPDPGKIHVGNFWSLSSPPNHDLNSPHHTPLPNPLKWYKSARYAIIAISFQNFIAFLWQFLCIHGNNIHNYFHDDINYDFSDFTECWCHQPSAHMCLFCFTDIRSILGNPRFPIMGSNTFHRLQIYLS